MKKMLLILMVVASVMTGDAHAQIGWTLDQCRKHWGQETDFIELNACPPPHETRPLYIFHYGKRYILEQFDDRNEKVIKETLIDSSRF